MLNVIGQRARGALAIALMEIRAGLVRVPPANNIRETFQEEVEVADMDLTLMLQVAAVDKAGHSPFLALKCERKTTIQKHQSLL